MKKSILMAMVVCVVLFGGCRKKDDSQKSRQETEVKNEKLGTAAAALTGLEWLKGEAVTFEAGQVYVVEFWATWCPPCRTSIPHLTKLQEEYKDKVTIIGVSTDKKKSADEVKQFVTDQGEKMEYTVAYESTGDVSKAYSDAFGQRGIPHAFIVDQAGKIAWFGHPARLDGVLKEVVAGSFDAVAYAAKKKQEEQAYIKNRKQMIEYFSKIESGNGEGTVKIAEEIIGNSSGQTLNGFAWKILTEVKEENRDLAAALKAAEKANEQAGGKNAAVLDTYALALFENGKIAEAISQQELAVEMAASNPKMQEELQGRVEEFKAAQNK